MSDQQLKNLLEHLAEPVQDMDDAVPASLARGRRSVRRRRAVLGIVGVVAVVAGTVGAVNLYGGQEEPGFAAPPTASPAPSPGADRAQFRSKVAAELDRLLPARFGKVTADVSIQAYWVTVDGAPVPLDFVVEKPQRGRPPLECAERKYMLSCIRTTVQPGGYPALASHGVVYDGAGRTIGVPTARVLYQGYDVQLRLYPVIGARKPIPISDQELLAVVSAPSLLALADEWAANPDWLAEVDPQGTPTR
ncbi:hypothetical protein [Kribbella sp. DT2]|uniref:hypothetical protein n=1 Tax=Kribbella sp. DT2 TaxID=3393427 RepID=UPI003CFB9FEB